MSDGYDQEAVDSAIILEGKIKERVAKIVRDEVVRIAGSLVQEAYAEYKNQMMMEISIKLGQILRNVEMEGRKPLWETDPNEFGMTPEDFKPHKFSPDRNNGAVKEINNAVHQNPPPV